MLSNPFGFLARRSIVLLVTLAMLALTLISLAGMSASVVVAETVQGGASGINAAGSLRRLAHRTASLVVADARDEGASGARVAAAIEDFERNLQHPAIQQVLDQADGGLLAATFRGVEASWKLNLRPTIETMAGDTTPPTPEQVETMLVEVDAFVDQLDTLVAVLEQDTVGRMEDLRQILAVAIVLIVLVVVGALVLLRRWLLRPMNGLLGAAQDIAGGDFSARVEHTGSDELGRVGSAFNLMADELSRHYQQLEERVAEKTAELQRSNRALELLYHAIARLYHSPTAAEAYEATLRDIDQVAGLAGSFVCIEPRHDGPANVIASTIGPCADRIHAGNEACQQCRVGASSGPRGAAGAEPLRIPLRDREHHYGMLRLSLPEGARLAEWQWQLVQALTRHIGMALGAARRTEQERLLALQEERSVIARELHDSLAQALSYMKIQVSLLQPVVADPARAAEATPIIADLREGINTAYRQLRELLVSFRLGLKDDLASMLSDAVKEYAARGDVEVLLDVRLADCALTPNQEVHVLQIVREALSNMVRHASATEARVSLVCDEDGEVTVTVDDDGVGLGEPPADAHNHHGMSIMRERAKSLGGALEISPRAGGGTRLRLRFHAALGEDAAAPMAHGVSQ